MTAIKDLFSLVKAHPFLAELVTAFIGGFVVGAVAF